MDDPHENNYHFRETSRFVVAADQLVSLSPSDLNLPSELCQSFWTVNTHNQRLITPSDRLFISYAPFLIGPWCSPIRLRDFGRILKMFTFWLILGQIAFYSYLVSITKTPYDIFDVDTYILKQFGCITYSEIKIKHQYWRFFSTILLHASARQLIIHLFIELAFLIPRESNWKIYRFFPIFLFSSFCGNFITLCIPLKYDSCGPGGGIFGVFGAFTSSYLVVVSKLAWKHRIGVLIMIFFLIILLIIAGSQDYNDSFGLFGGFAFGVFGGLVAFANKAEDPSKVKACYTIGVICSVLFLVVPALVFIFEPQW